VGPSAPSISTPLKQAREASAHSRLVFAEFFAGSGELTRTMQDRGVACRRADDAASGGTDFEVAAEIAILKEDLRDLRTEGAVLALHLAPPCSSFSRARDRAQSTKLRSTSHPEGQPGLDADQRSLVTTANKIALQAFDFAVWAARDLSAVVSMENPSVLLHVARAGACQAESKGPLARPEYLTMHVRCALS
jgi:site-specific DNA-cytosine methylase